MDIGLISETIQLPSGAEAEVREMSGREEDLFANEKLVKSGQVGHQLLGNVILKLNGEKPTSADVHDMWSADRTAVMLKMRELTFGPELQGEHECSNEDCGAGIKITLDHIIDDLEYQERPEELENVVNVKGVGSFTLRPAKGGDETKLLQAQQKGELVTEMLFTRISDFDAKDIGSRQQLKNFLRNGPVRVRRQLQRALDGMDFGYKTQLDLVCPVCGTEQSVDIFGLQGFFFPEEASQ